MKIMKRRNFKKLQRKPDKTALILTVISVIIVGGAFIHSCDLMPVATFSYIRLLQVNANDLHYHVTEDAEALVVTNRWGYDRVIFYNFHSTDELNQITIEGGEARLEPFEMRTFTKADVPDEEWDEWLNRYKEKRPLVSWPTDFLGDLKDDPDPTRASEFVKYKIFFW